MSAPSLLERLRREARRRSDDARAQLDLAILLLDPAARSGSRRRRLRARDVLERLLARQPRCAEAHALLAHALALLGDLDGAAAQFRAALRGEPGRESWRDYLLEILDAAGRQEALARRLRAEAAARGVDLPGLRAELRAAGMPSDAPTLRLNAFPSGRLQFESELLDAVERLDGAPDRDAEAQAARAAVRVDARSVPADLRTAVPLARRWGVSDDADRGRLVGTAGADERREMRRVLTTTLRRRIDAWLDVQLARPEPSEASVAFLYLLEAFEEMKGGAR